MVEEDSADAGASTAWAQAREKSQQLIIQEALEDLENKAAKSEQELRMARSTLEQQRNQVAALQAEKTTLQTTVEQQSTETSQLKASVQTRSAQCQALEESQTQSNERMDRLQAEEDKLREEIRYVCDGMEWGVESK
jgi:chromosome segregation ATPase